MCFHIILQLHFKDVHDLLFDLFIFHRKYNLHTFIKVSRHPVRASHIHFFASSAAKVKDSRVLQKVSDNGAYGNRFAHARNTRLQTADSPDDQINLHTRRGRTVQRRNNISVAKRIHLRDNARFLPFSGVLFLHGNQVQEPVAHPKRRY